MSKSKAADQNGAGVELIQESGMELLGLIAELFTDILGGSEEVPQYWKETRLKVLF